MKEYDKPNSHISSKLHMIPMPSNNIKHPVSKTFSPLHSTSPNCTSLHFSTLHFLPLKLHPTTIHYTVNWLKTTLISCRSTSPHFTTLHFVLLCVGLTVPVATRSKTWVCVRSPAGIACSNPTGGEQGCLFRLLCVVRYRSLSY